MSVFIRNQNTIIDSSLTKDFSSVRDYLSSRKNISDHFKSPEGKKSFPKATVEELKYIVSSQEELLLLVHSLKINHHDLLTKNQLAKTEEIPPGLILVIPGWTIVKYIVQAGDSIGEISRRFNIPIPALTIINYLTSDAMLVPGQILFIPESYFENGLS